MSNSRHINAATEAPLTVDEPLVGFLGLVHREGYRWLETRGMRNLKEQKFEGPFPFLTPGIPIGARGQPLRGYDLFEDEPVLFRTLAGTQPTAEGIQAFADRYGMLGGEATWSIVLEEQGQASGSHLIGFGESISIWQETIRLMRTAVRLWDMAQKRDVEGLAPHIQWSDDGSISYSTIDFDTDPDAATLGERGWFTPGNVTHAAFIEHIDHGDVISPALYLVQKLINDQLKDRTSARLQYDVRLGRPRLHLVAYSTAGALWLQFAQAVHAAQDYRVCPQCGRWFEAQPGAWHARSDRLYCSHVCRSKAYRTRKARLEKG